ncbi:hypothetical protein G5V57_21595 [Nordella sp. HKS 07]|uniref:hypothetical protein n=1 Tax=Nordella sp. HKS 07 TaxID=2712222 RepID=UPI0013E0EF10|nr:hypothetical protein [Nordella sp. HKS 07]QIG50086.1 hypothetical protein G5V57_21595 [Nordella sp. HKS 07]
MDFIIQLVLGALGGNGAGAAVKNASLGTVGNSIVGAVGGLILGQILQHYMGMSAADASATSSNIIQSVIGGAGGGAILTVIAGLIKNAMSKG